MLARMKNVSRIYLVCTALLWMGTGCITTEEAGPPPASQADVRYLREEIRRLNARMDAVNEELGSLQQDIMNARADRPDTASASQLQAVQNEVADLQTQIRSVDAARVKDNKKIYDDLTTKITKMLKSSSSSAAASRSRPRTGSQTGIEHVVQSGQTLSQIAQAYGVSVSVLVEENGLKSADAIYAGQKLFIPE